LRRSLGGGKSSDCSRLHGGPTEARSWVPKQTKGPAVWVTQQSNWLCFDDSELGCCISSCISSFRRNFQWEGNNYSLYLIPLANRKLFPFVCKQTIAHNAAGSCSYTRANRGNQTHPRTNNIEQEDLLSHGDEVYDIIEEQDKKSVRSGLLSNESADELGASPSSQQHSPLSSPRSVCGTGPQTHAHPDPFGQPESRAVHEAQQPVSGETRIALCRMNVSRNARRQMRFGDQKIVLIEGHFFGYLPLSSRDEPVFIATCTPLAMPETRECVVQGSTNVFTSIHSMDMKFLYIDAM